MLGLVACENKITSSGSPGDDGPGTTWKKAVPVPEQTETDMGYETIWSEDFSSTNPLIPEGMLGAVYKLQEEIGPMSEFDAARLQSFVDNWRNYMYRTFRLSKRAVTEVENAILYQYGTAWVDPDHILSFEISQIEANSLKNTITESIGLTAAFQGIGFNASLTKTTEEVTAFITANTETHTWDLCEYEQDKEYRVILKGNYTIFNYEIRTLGDGITYLIDFDTIEIDNDSLKMELVQRPKN